MDALLGRKLNGLRRSWTAITLYWASSGGNTPQGTNYTATCLPSRKLSKLDEPDMQDTAGEAGTSSLVMYSYWPPFMAEQKQDDHLEHTYSSYVRIRDVALKTCRRRWTIRRSGERGSGICLLAARHDDDHYQGVPAAQIPFTLSCKLSLLAIILGKSSGQHPVFLKSFCRLQSVIMRWSR